LADLLGYDFGMINNHSDSENGRDDGTRKSEEHQPNTAEEPNLRKAEIAEWLGVTPRTVNSYMRQRTIPFRKGPKFVLFKKSEVEAALLRKVEPERESVEKIQRSKENEPPKAQN
jgi:predicted DNA-binding transcriptional regulator AlpA